MHADVPLSDLSAKLGLLIVSMDRRVKPGGDGAKDAAIV
jgi:hypothetical protein